jgi:hypothetical protein
VKDERNHRLRRSPQGTQAEQQRLERKQAELLDKRSAEIGRLAERLGLLEADDDTLPAHFPNSRMPYRSPVTSASRGGVPRARPFVEKTRTVKLLRRARTLAWRNQTRMRRVADAERRLDTRRKIQLGGLVIKAGLDSEESAVILGILTAAKRVLSGQHAADSRRRWKELGDQAFGPSA